MKLNCECVACVDEQCRIDAINNTPRPGDRVDIAPNQQARPGVYGVRVGRYLAGDAVGNCIVDVGGEGLDCHVSELTVVERKP